MITRLRLKNWKSHIDSELRFSPGVNALVGIVGSGKTSIMQAISFALFGTFGGLKSRRLGLDDLIMKRPARKKQAEVELELEAAGNKYTVLRVIEEGKGTTRAELRRNGELLDVNAKNVTGEIERALQIDYELFSRAVYSEQNFMDYFLRIPRGQRMEHIDKLLKVHRFGKAKDSANSIGNKVAERREEKMRILQELGKEDFGKRIRDAEGEVEKIQGEIRGLEGNMRSVKEEKKEVSQKLSSMESKQEEVEEMGRMLEGLKAGLKEIEETLEKSGNENPEKIREGIEKLRTALNSRKETLEEKKRDFESRREELASFNERVRMLVESKKDLENVDAKCPVCESEVGEEKKKELLERRNREESGLREKVTETAKELEGIKAERDRLEGEIRDIELKIERMSTRLEKAEDIESMRRKKEEKEEQKRELEKTKGELENEFSRKEVNKLRERLQEIVGKEKGILARMSSLEEMRLDKEESLTELRRRKETLDRYMGETKVDERIVDDMKKLVNVLKATQEGLRQEFVKTVNHIMEEVWGELYPYGDYTGVRLTVDDDYVLELRSSEGWIPVEGVASGGERSMACLALRIAFSHAFIPNLSWLILDEPTHNLDTNSINQLSSVLRDRISSFAQQVFIITHEERVSEGADIIYRMERDKGRNEATRVVAG